MKKQTALQLILFLLVPFVQETSGFVTFTPRSTFTATPPTRRLPLHPWSVVALSGAVQDLDVVGLVAGQENYGLAIVCVGEAIWSFLSAPSFSHAKVLVPAAVAALVLILVSGPMVTSGDVGSVGSGLWIATAVSTGLGISYIARLLAPFSPSPKEIAALGLLVAIAGFFSFSQNLLVDGFVSLPSLSTFEIPEINLDGPVENSLIEASASIPDVSLETPLEIPEVSMETPSSQAPLSQAGFVADSIPSIGISQ
jgi:hypothetical protein